MLTIDRSSHFTTETVDALVGNWGRQWTKLNKSIPHLSSRLETLLDEEVFQMLQLEETLDQGIDDTFDDIKFSMVLAEQVLGTQYIAQQLWERPDAFVFALTYVAGELQTILLTDDPWKTYVTCFFTGYPIAAHAVARFLVSEDPEGDDPQPYDAEAIFALSRLMIGAVTLPEGVAEEIMSDIYQGITHTAEEDMADAQIRPIRTLN